MLRFVHGIFWPIREGQKKRNHVLLLGWNFPVADHSAAVFLLLR